MKPVVKWILLSLVGAGLLVVLIPLGFWLYLTIGAANRLRQFRDATEIVVQSREGDGWGTVEEIRDRSVIREVVDDFVAGDSGLDDEGPSSACPFFLRLNFLVGGTTKAVVVGTDDCQQFYSRDLGVSGTFRDRKGGKLAALVEGARRVRERPDAHNSGGL